MCNYKIFNQETVLIMRIKMCTLRLEVNIFDGMLQPIL